MFRSTRDDTLIKTIEARYGIDLHARGDTNWEICSKSVASNHSLNFSKHIAAS